MSAKRHDGLGNAKMTGYDSNGTGTSKVVPHWGLGSVVRYWLGRSVPAYLHQRYEGEAGAIPNLNPDDHDEDGLDENGSGGRLMREAREAVWAEVDMCFAQWNYALGGRIMFERAANIHDADVLLQFMAENTGELPKGFDAMAEGGSSGAYGTGTGAGADMLEGDGLGGQLAASGKGYIYFDKAER